MKTINLVLPVEAPHDVMETLEEALLIYAAMLEDGDSANEAAHGAVWADQELATVRALLIELRTQGG